MSKDKQSGLEGLLDDLVDQAIEFGHDDYTGTPRTKSERAKDYEKITTMIDSITSNYTPNTTVEQLKSRIAWLEGMVEGFTEMYKRGYIDGGISELTKVQDQLFKGNELFRYSRKRVNELTKKEETK